MYKEEINIIKNSLFIRENIKEEFIKILLLWDVYDLRIKNILEILELVKNKEEFFKRELDKIKNNISEDINIFLKTLPKRKDIIKNMEENEELEEENLDNLLNNI